MDNARSTSRTSHTIAVGNNILFQLNQRSANFHIFQIRIFDLGLGVLNLYSLKELELENQIMSAPFLIQHLLLPLNISALPLMESITLSIIPIKFIQIRTMAFHLQRIWIKARSYCAGPHIEQNGLKTKYFLSDTIFAWQFLLKTSFLIT